MRAGKRCTRNCTNVAGWRVLLILPIPNEHDRTMRMSIRVCALCKRGLAVDDVLTQTIWEGLVGMFERMERPIPNRDEARIDFERLP